MYIDSKCMKHSIDIDSSVQMETEKASTPKLSLSSSFPSFSRRLPSTLGPPVTPPMRLQGAIPFQWEEKPGRPRKQLQPGPMQISGSKQEPSSLRLPPRLTSTNKMMMLSSPRSVIEGPYRRSVSVRRLVSLSFGKKKKKKKLTMVRLDKSPTSTSSEEEEPTPKSFASNYYSSNSSLKSCSSVSSSMCSFYSYGSGESAGTTEEEGEEEEKEVRILRCMRRRSLVTCVTSYTDSLLRASIFGRLKKHAACWKDPKF